MIFSFVGSGFNKSKSDTGSFYDKNWQQLPGYGGISENFSVFQKLIGFHCNFLV